MLFTKFFMVNNLSLLYSFKLEVVPTSNNVNLTLLSYVCYVIGYSIDYSSTLQYSKQILASFTLIWNFLSYTCRQLQFDACSKSTKLFENCNNGKSYFIYLLFNWKSMGHKSYVEVMKIPSSDWHNFGTALSSWICIFVL